MKKKIYDLFICVLAFVLLFSGFPSAPGSEPAQASQALLFSEYFDRPDGLIGTDYGIKDPLGKWTVTSEEFYAKNSHGWTNSPVFRAVTQKSDFTDFTLSAKMLKKDLGVEAWEGLQLFFRYHDQYNLYVAGIRNDNQLQLKKKVNNVYYTLGMAPIQSNKLDYWYNFKVITNGTRIQVFVDDVKYIDVTDSSFSYGKVGIRTDNIEAYFDDFEVRSNLEDTSKPNASKFKVRYKNKLQAHQSTVLNGYLKPAKTRRKVIVYHRARLKKWTSYKTKKTTKSGSFAAKLSPKMNTQYKIYSPKSGSFTEASKLFSVKVKPVIRLGVKQVPWKRKVSGTGVIKVWGQTSRYQGPYSLRVRMIVGNRWQTVKLVKVVDTNGRFSTYIRARKGIRSVRMLIVANPRFTTTYSGIKRVGIR